MIFRRAAGLMAVAAFTVLASIAANAAGTTQASSPATDQKYVWDLTDLYPTPDAWTAEYAKIKAETDKLGQI